MAEAPAFRGNSYRHGVALNRWIARVRKEQAFEPHLPIIDPHHHLWDDDRGPYLLPDILGDIGGGHNVKATVFIECRTHYRACATDAERPLGEVKFVNGISAMSASGGHGPTCVAAAIVGRADLRLGEKVQDILEKQIALTRGRMRGIRWSIPYDATEVGKHVPALSRKGFRAMPRGAPASRGWQNSV